MGTIFRRTKVIVLNNTKNATNEYDNPAIKLIEYPSFNKIIASKEATKLTIVNISNKLFFLSAKNPATNNPKQ